MTRDNLESPKSALETTSSFETRPAGSTVSPDVGSSASDVVEREMPSSTHGRPEKGSSKQDLHLKPNRDEPAPRPSFMAGWKGLAVSAILALVCGAASAWAFTELLGPSKAQEPSSGGQKKQQGDNQGRASSGGPGKFGGEQGAASGQEGGSSEDKSCASASQIPGFTSADDADTLKKQIAHLSQRVDRLDRRLDSLKKPENEPPPGLHTLQVQVTELTKELDETANLPAEFRDLERRLSAVEQKVKSLRDHAASDSGASDEKSSGETTSSDAKRSTPTGG